MGLSFIIAAGLRQRILRSESRGTHDHILLSQIRDSPNLEGWVPQEQGGPVIPPGTGFPFRRFLRLAVLRWRYSKPPPHGMDSWPGLGSSLYNLGAGPVENTVSKISSIVMSRVRCRGEVFTVPQSSNGRLFLLNYSGFQPSCHNI
jgi:hypothetical protein